MDEDRRKITDRREPFMWPHEHCEEDCPVAIRNQERIATLFIRVDEMKEAVGTAIKWKHFMWLIGTFLLILGTVNTLIYESYSRDKMEMLHEIRNMAAMVAKNKTASDVAAIRMDNFAVTREDLMIRHRRDHDKLDTILEVLVEDLKILNRNIGHKHMIPKK